MGGTDPMPPMTAAMQARRPKAARSATTGPASHWACRCTQAVPDLTTPDVILSLGKFIGTRYRQPSSRQASGIRPALEPRSRPKRKPDDGGAHKYNDVQAAAK